MKAREQVCFPLTEYIAGDHTEENVSVRTRMTASDGAFGEIWQACVASDPLQSGRPSVNQCRYILKYQPFREENESKGLPAITRDTISREATLQRELAKLKLAPQVKDSWLCETGGVIVMPALKRTAYGVFQLYDDPEVHYLILASCLALIRRLHEEGYYHGDASISNIMVNYSADDLEAAEEEDTDMKKYKAMDYKYYFIDMGFSGRLDQTNNPRSGAELIKNDYQILALSMQEKYDSSSGDDQKFGPLINFMSEYMRR